MTHAVHVEDHQLAGYAAEQAIKELQARPDVTDYYRQHRDGHCDFVFVEEGVDSLVTAAFARAGLRPGRSVPPFAFEQACAPVFAWLRAEHGVQPPAWFKRWLDGVDDAKEGGGR